MLLMLLLRTQQVLVLLLFFLLLTTTAVAVASAVSSSAASSSTQQQHVVKLPSFSISELLTGQNRLDDELSNILTTTGILAVDITKKKSTTTTTPFHQKLCDCSEKLQTSGDASHVVPNTDTVILQHDGITKRTTLATATSGTTPLPLPSKQLDQVCGAGTASDLDDARDVVAEASDAFVTALDRLLLSASGSHQYHNVLLKNKYGASYPSVSAIRDKSNNLEHFHVYEKKKKMMVKKQQRRGGGKDSSLSSYSLDWHTDAGLFLSFLPARNCKGDDEISNAFWIRDEMGIATQIQFSPDTVVIMLGAGAEHWLNTSPRLLQLKATKHAVKMHPNEKRAWYGMMHLVPDHAIIEQGKTFADMREAMVLQKDRVYGQQGHGNESSISIGCGLQQQDDDEVVALDEGKYDGLAVVTSTKRRRRRLQHVQDARACNNATNFFCWMQCLDIPNHEDAENYANGGYSLYCLDPAILASSGNQVSKAVEPCGLVHNAACMGSWQPTAPGVPSTEVEYNVTALPEAPFCYGGTSMYMDGFHWLDTTCVIYLFPSWVLTTPSKMVAAAFGSFAVSVLLEKVIQLRRSAVSPMQPGYLRLGASGLTYGVQLTLGYFIMLAVMTYSGPIFMCIILGLVAGHILFNAKDSPFASTKPKAQPVPQQDPSTPSISISDGGGASKPSCCSGGGNDDDDDNDSAGVPEGITPCCQNKL